MKKTKHSKEFIQKQFDELMKKRKKEKTNEAEKSD
jgi:hypothetical protein